MYEIRVQAGFSAAHNLKDYRGKCEKLHGHNWKVEAAFSYEALDKDGMAVDFKEVKAALRTVLEKFDHSYLNKLDCFKKMNPTSENMARHIYDRLKRKNKHVSSVRVWENETSSAEYR